jgi:poly-gamma-glutamate synthesis protein (capsule biosynthesis protein)
MASILIIGDFFPVPTNFTRFQQADVSYLLGERLCDLFRSADYRICNLEGALTDKPGYCEKTGPALYAPTTCVNAYTALGINCCTLANNHITDAGSEGLLDTVATLDKAGIKHLGAGQLPDIRRHIFFEVGGKTICLYNVAETMYNAPTQERPGAFLYDEYLVCRELEQLKKKADYLIVVYHGGVEKFRYPSPQTRLRFHRMVDSGADVILSQHTHCVGSEEYYKGAYLLYGQGNFLFRSFNNEFTDTGLAIELLLDDKGFSVKKHMVHAVEDRVIYDEKQDFSDFDERSSHITDDAFLRSQFRTYCGKKVFPYLVAYKGKNFIYKALGRISPKLRNRFIGRSYTRTQLLLTLHSLRSEQNREVAIEGIIDLLEKRK